MALNSLIIGRVVLREIVYFMRMAIIFVSRGPKL